MLGAINSAGRYVSAWEADRSGKYQCPGCEEPVTVKLGDKVTWHFAHYADAPCSRPGETWQHVEMKTTLHQELQKTFGASRCGVERPLGDRRADAWVNLNGEGEEERLLVFECQHSKVSANEVAAKIADYARLGIACLYIVHGEAFGDDYSTIHGPWKMQHREITVPDWVRAVATPDLRTERESSDGDPPHAGYWQSRIHLWHNRHLYAVSLALVEREGNKWRKSAHILSTRCRARVEWYLPTLCGPWRVVTDRSSPAYFDALFTQPEGVVRAA